MSPTLAFFDMDYTLLDTSSGLLYVKYLRQTGQIQRHVLARVAWWTLLYKLTLIDMSQAFPKMMTFARDTSATETLADCRTWFNSMVRSHLNAAAIDKIRWHQQQGHHVVIISASTQFAVQPVAEHLGLDFLCTQLAVDGDRLTGRLIEPACYAEGKVVWAKQYAERVGAELRVAYFYTDSLSDRALLEIIGQPVAVNPDPRLKRLAVQRGWPIEKFY
ncbi:MAG: HAD family hydrolase [Anaerolineae bacterium]